MKKLFLLIVLFFASAFFTPAFSSDNADEKQLENYEKTNRAFKKWINGEFKKEALAAGISETVFDVALAEVNYLDDVIKNDRNQGEFVRNFAEYYARAVTSGRIKEGQKHLKKLRSLLNNLTKIYGIPSQILVAFWGLETSFGRNFGRYNVLESMATLAFDNRRRDFFKDELIIALRLLETQHLMRDVMVGSWAGAMGNMQFMPSTLIKHAVDGDGDGKVDVWNSLPDAFSSAGHFLKELGWKRGKRWGREVILPKNFDYKHALSHKNMQPSSLWRNLGVKLTDGTQVADSDRMAAVFAPLGSKGPAFLLYDNFYVIMKWNNSTAYALSVGILADRLVNRSALKTPFVSGELLSFIEIKELQQFLKYKEYYEGKIDGIIGTKMKRATYEYQKDKKLKVVDGFPDAETYMAAFSSWRGFDGITLRKKNAKKSDEIERKSKAGSKKVKKKSAAKPKAAVTPASKVSKSAKTKS